MADVLGTIIGDKELIANLELIRKNVRRTVVKSAMRKGAAVVAKNARKKIKKRSGMLAKAIRSGATRNENGRIYVNPKVIGEYGGKKVWPVKYAHLVEFGTREAEAHPFFRPALEESKQEAFAAVEKEAVRKFNKLAAQGKTVVR